jgi:hypothetical protein
MEPLTYLATMELEEAALAGFHHTGFGLHISPHIAACSARRTDAYDYYD